MTMIGLAISPCIARATGTSTPTISATAPVLAALADGDTLSDAVTWGAVTPIDGVTITETRQMRLSSGGEWAAYDGDHVAEVGETISVRQVWEAEGYATRTLASAAQVVAGIAPEIAASDALDGRVLTITVDSLTGEPTPDVALTALTLDGADVLGDASGTGPWTYWVPDSASAQTVTWTVTATNSAGSDTASGSETVAANQIAVEAITAPSISDTTPAPGQTVTITEGTYSGTPAPTITGELLLGGVDVTGSMEGLSYTIPMGTPDGTSLSWSEMAWNGVEPAAFQSASATVTLVATTAPSDIVVLGASIIHQAVGGPSESAAPYSVPANAAMTAALRALRPGGEWDGVTIRGFGIPALRMGSYNVSGIQRSDDFASGFSDALAHVRAAYPDAWIVVHLGGGDVTDFRPLGTMSAGEVTEWNDALAAMLAEAETDGGTFFFGNLTFRNYGGATFVDPSLGSAPFNTGGTATGGAVTGMLPAIEASFPTSIKSTGRPFFDFYRATLQGFDTWLEADNVHPNATGEAGLRDYIVATLADILSGAEPADISERTAVLNVTAGDAADLTIEVDLGATDVIDSITLSDDNPGTALSWEGTWATYADGTSLNLGALGEVAARCLIAPVVTHDGAGANPVPGDTVSIPDIGVWLYEGNTEPTYVVQWHDDYGPISGATGLSFTVTTADVGNFVFPLIEASLAGKTGTDYLCSGFLVDSPFGTWAFSGSIVTNIPASEGWAFSGSIVTNIPEAA